MKKSWYCVRLSRKAFADWVFLNKSFFCHSILQSDTLFWSCFQFTFLFNSTLVLVQTFTLPASTLLALLNHPLLALILEACSSWLPFSFKILPNWFFNKQKNLRHTSLSCIHPSHSSFSLSLLWPSSLALSSYLFKLSTPFLRFACVFVQI